MLEYLWQDWDGVNWINLWMESCTYDLSDNLVELLGRNWDGTTWINIYKETYTYSIIEIEQPQEGINFFSLYSNYPNPFNPSTKIKYSISQSSNVVIKVFDIIGNEIEVLIDEEKPADTYEITWYAENLPSGVYFYRMQAYPVNGRTGSFIETKKMVLIK